MTAVMRDPVSRASRTFIHVGRAVGDSAMSKRSGTALDRV